jgi:hypothetical protein
MCLLDGWETLPLSGCERPVLEFSARISHLEVENIAALDECQTTEHPQHLAKEKSNFRPPEEIEDSAPGPIRTGDLRIRSPTLYPAELQARAADILAQS